MAEYTLAQTDDPVVERERLRLLQACCDPWTIAYLNRLGVAPGWHCLDVGAGGGSIAHWMAGRVSPNGSVTAIDLNLTLLKPLVSPNLAAVRVDVRNEDLPSNADLVHSRLLLEHLQEREAVLQRMVRALRPGGWLVVADSDFRSVAIDDPDAAFRRVASSFAPAMQAGGWEPQLGPALPSMLEQAGLVDVYAESWQTYERGGKHALLLAMTYERLRNLFTAYGVASDDVSRAVLHLKTPDVGFFSPTIWTARGRRPAAA